jgi:transcriptional regulator with XRE-family HTH domain
MLNYSRFKNVLEVQKITLKFVAEKIGMTSHGLSAAFKNNTLKVRDLQSISEVLDVPVSTFFDDKESGGSNIGNFQDTSIVNNTGSNFNISTGGKKEVIDFENKELRKNNLLYWDVIENLVSNQSGLMVSIVKEAPEMQPFIAKQNEFKLFIRQLNTLLKLTDNKILLNDSFFDYFENPY